MEMMDSIEFIINNKNLNITIEIKDLTILLYNEVRENPEHIILYYDIVTSLITNIIDNTYIENYTKILSLIAFKNDIILQYDLKKERIDLYLQEVLFIIDKKPYIYDSFIIAKLTECLAKIQFAYTLIKCNINIRDKYISFLNIVNKNNIFKTIIDELNDLSHIDVDSISKIFEYYNLFNFDNTNKDTFSLNVLKNPIFEIIRFWKLYKINYYHMSEQDIIDEGIDSYNLIYKEKQ